MLFSPSFLRAGCCALALQIVTSFPSIAMTGDEEVRGSKTAAPMAHLDETDPSYSGVKSLMGQEPTAEEIAAYPEFNAFFEDGVSFSSKQENFTDYLAAKAAGISIKSQNDLAFYQVAKMFFKTDPTAAQFADFGDFQEVLNGPIHTIPLSDFTDYLAAKAAGLSADYQATKNLLEADPTADQVAAYSEFNAFFNFTGGTYPGRQLCFIDYLAAKAADISTIKSNRDLYDYQAAKKFLGTDPTAAQFADFGDFKKTFNGNIYSLPLHYFTDYLAAKTAGISPDYYAAKEVLGTDPTADQVAAFPEFIAHFKNGYYLPTRNDFRTYLAAKAAGISIVNGEYDLLSYRVARELLGANPTAAQLAAYHTLKDEMNFGLPTKAEIEDRAQQGS